VKILTVGDPHVTVTGLENCGRLLNFIYKVAEHNKVDLIEFTGDLLHSHALVRQEVLEFWRAKLTHLSKLNIPIIIIAGNHDFCGDKSHEGDFSAISDLKHIENIIVVNKRLLFYSPVGPIGYRAYTSNHELLVQDAIELHKEGANRILTHQTFTGAQYDNGFYAKDAIDPELLPQKHVISGHIHTTSQIGKCFYVGSPKADTMADANQEKGVWLFEYDGDSQTKQFISTEGVVDTYKKFTVNEGEDLPEFNPLHRNYIELVGSNSWITSFKKKLKNINNLQIKASPTDTRISAQTVKITGIADYLSTCFKPIDGISLSDIETFLGELNAK